MLRLILPLAALAALLVAGPAAATPQPAPDSTIASATAILAQVETTPGDEPAPEEDVDEEEIGEEFEAPAEDEEPERDEEAQQEEAAPAAPAPSAAPAAAELPRTGPEQRLLLVAMSALLAGLALRRVARPH